MSERVQYYSEKQIYIDLQKTQQPENKYHNFGNIEPYALNKISLRFDSKLFSDDQMFAFDTENREKFSLNFDYV
ncbi:hypothetical protein M0812_03444 [Anaeramoeba flamelloides]|uniref:Uncharacterized protein n=1 Tax=Anaeramoeba flamelloides TaxID=1746091 RepID=A0AAV8AFE6_9EUKA|nr:hypothetical protein M0812_03444 [Anaeramoeba flamelloides]